MVKRLVGAALVSIGVAFWSGCGETVDCEYCCSYGGSSATCLTSAKIDKDRCEGCDFPAVNIYQNNGYSCTCSAK